MPDCQAEDGDAAILNQVQEGGAKEGIWRRQRAAEFRAFASRVKGMTPDAARDQADCLDAEADALLDVQAHTGAPVTVGVGREVVGDKDDVRRCVDTLLNPDAVAVDASRHRLALADKAGGMALALDAAETIQAANALEKMLGHQIALAHVAALETQAEALALLKDFRNTGGKYAMLTTEAARLFNVSAKMMGTTQSGISTLHRLRTSGRQTLVVQHVHVSDGGQAVVAGQMKGRRQRRTAARGG